MVEKISASVLEQFPEYHLSWLEMWALYRIRKQICGLPLQPRGFNYSFV